MPYHVYPVMVSGRGSLRTYAVGSMIPHWKLAGHVSGTKRRGDEKTLCGLRTIELMSIEDLEERRIMGEMVAVCYECTKIDLVLGVGVIVAPAEHATAAEYTTAVQVL